MSIKSIIDKFWGKREFTLNSNYRYCGPGTNLRAKIRNLDYIRQSYDSYKLFPTLDKFVFYPKGEPLNVLDKQCLFHDLYYWIAESYKSSKRLNMEHLADRILLADCHVLLITLHDIERSAVLPDSMSLSMNPKQIEEYRDDIRMVIGLITCKMNMEEMAGSWCCILS